MLQAHQVNTIFISKMIFRNLKFKFYLGLPGAPGLLGPPGPPGANGLPGQKGLSL